MAATDLPDRRADPARLAPEDASTIAAQPSPATGSTGNARTTGSPATGSTGSRSAGSRRSEAARLAVLNAADDLLVEHGFEGLTIEGIAAAAGVAKQTIYRWWKSKVDILFDNLVLDAGTALGWPEHPSGPADVRAYVHRFAAFLGEDPAGRVLQALLGHAQLDPRTAELLHSGFLDELRARDVAHVRTCLGLADDDRAAVVLDAVLAPLYHRALVLRRPLDAAFVDALLDQQLDEQPAR
ncbi:TetR/AcrR family transcriptional regulator [Kitasatospora sp. CM 4170]|uniref:TetR/AcrR family transcriptional regulator n=1 Tax=Kitasatospora aburaviensis TaxID=67265 RepID=A0ABW1ENS2_9ACTN|nr:TetR/AcrR family transcriptional regulator [Kitasatospora sp. CM 4170]WNM48433.1 TetR/AcrR family transcriptional regulator [Kitasatospora sp. CM 4170]